MDEKTGSQNSLVGFLKKRAPIYLGLTALFLIFAIPQLTSEKLEDLFPDDLTDAQKQVLDIVMEYDGPNQRGLTILEAMDLKIREKYPDVAYEKSDITLAIEGQNNNHTMTLVFETKQNELTYIWSVDTESGQITGQNNNTKNVINLVDFYD